MKKSLGKTQNHQSDLNGEEELKKIKQQKKSKESYLEYGFDDEDDLKEYEKFLR